MSDVYLKKNNGTLTKLNYLMTIIEINGYVNGRAIGAKYFRTELWISKALLLGEYNLMNPQLSFRLQFVLCVMYYNANTILKHQHIPSPPSIHPSSLMQKSLFYVIAYPTSPSLLADP